MIVAQRRVHHGPDDDVAIASDGPLLYGVQSEDAALRQVFAHGVGNLLAVRRPEGLGQRQPARGRFHQFQSQFPVFVDLRAELEAEGAIFQASSDTEVILHLVAHSREKTLPLALREALLRLEGAFSLDEPQA